MARVRFAGVPGLTPPRVTHDAWGSDEEEEQQQQHSRASAQNAQQRQQRQQQQQQQPRLPAPIISQLPRSREQPAASSQTATAATAAKQATMHLSLCQQQQQQQVLLLPSLQVLCLGVLGRHVTQLVEQLDGQLGWLPADVKAALLAVARRRGEVTGAVLSALVDADWTQLDLAGCRRLYAAEVLAVAPAMPNIRVLDVTGFEQLVAGGWRQLARAWPHLTILRLGGSETADREALKALPHILPGITPTPVAAAAASSAAGTAAASLGQAISSNRVSAAAAAEATAEPVGGEGSCPTACSKSAAAPAEEAQELDSWEHAFDSDTEEEASSLSHFASTGTSSQQQQQQREQHDSTASNSSSSGNLQPSARIAAAAVLQDCRLRHLRVLVWPGVSAEAVQLVQQRCPRVVINPAMKPDAVTGLLPPREVDPSVALDEPLMELVGEQALQDIAQRPGDQQPGSLLPIVHIADKFRAAYIQQAARLRDKEQRLWKAQQRKQLRSSHALRTVNAWLDEPA